MYKDTKGKPPLQLLKRTALELMAQVRSFGQNKYQDYDDQHGLSIDPELYLGGALRHLYKHLDGEIIDIESGLPHLAHAMCAIMLAIEIDFGQKK